MEFISVAGDISSETFVNSFVDLVVSKFGRIDYAVNCAGVMGNNQTSTETSLEEFDKINNVNYRGLWLCSRAEIRAMLKQSPLPSHDSARTGERGSVVNIASQLGIVGRSAARKFPIYFFGKADFNTEYRSCVLRVESSRDRPHACRCY